jgi:hypothetical protein
VVIYFGCVSHAVNLTSNPAKKQRFIDAEMEERWRSVWYTAMSQEEMSKAYQSSSQLEHRTFWVGPFRAPCSLYSRDGHTLGSHRPRPHLVLRKFPAFCGTVGPVHFRSFYTFKIHLINRPSMPRSPKWSLPSGIKMSKPLCSTLPAHTIPLI